MKKTALIISIFFLGIVTVRGQMLFLLHEEQKKVKTINKLIIRLTNIKKGKTINDDSSINASGRELKKAYKNYEDGAFNVSFPIFKKHADNGNATANYYLARSYYFGQGVSQNYPMAINYFKQNKGYSLIDARSLFILSRCYRYGRGTAIDIKKAESLVIEAAYRGLNDAIELLQIEKDMSRNDIIDWLISVLNTELDDMRKRKDAIEHKLMKAIPDSVPSFGLA